MWSVGCIYGEFFLGKVMFEGRCEEMQGGLILGGWGHVRGGWGTEAFKSFREGRFKVVEGEVGEGEDDNVGGKWFDERNKLSRTFFPGLGEIEEELLKGMLRYDRRRRLTAREAVLKYGEVLGYMKVFPEFRGDGAIIN